MIANTFLKRLAAALFAATILFFPAAQTAQAETITVIPPKFELFGNPGDTLREKLRVRNDGTEVATYQTDVQDFGASGEDGGVNIIDDPEAPRTTFSLKQWVTIEPSRFTVQPGEERTVDISIKLPRDAEPGGHYASVQIKLAGGAVSGGASVESRLNSLILFRVSGDLRENLTVNSFKTNKNYYQKGPVDFVLSTKNEGNVHVAPSGTIVITDIFNRKVKEIPLRQANVLPESSRSITTPWEDVGMVGRYTATLVSTYGQSNLPITASTTFIVFPPYLAAIIVGVIALVYLFITKRKKIRKFLNKLTAD